MITPLEFYQGQPLLLKNGESLTIQEILNKDNDWWDGCHDFIQWMFPTRTPSQYCLDAPLLTKEMAAEIQKRHSFMVGVCAERFFKFLSSQNMDMFNHNHLRITRFIEFVSLVNHSMEILRSPRFFLIHCQRFLPLTVKTFTNGNKDEVTDYNLETFEYWLKAFNSTWDESSGQ